MKAKKVFALLALLAFVLPVALGACAPKATPTAAPAKTEAPTKAPQPTAAPTKAPTPTPAPAGPKGVTADDLQGTTIVLWFPWSRQSGDAFTKLVDEFNSTNKWGITVKAQYQGHYSQIYDKMNAAINSGDLPNVVVGYNNQMLAWDDAGGVIADMQPYVDNAAFGLSKDEQADFYDLFWKQDVVNGKRYGFPVMRSAQVVYYNVTWAKELGFDKAPTTTEEFKEQACAAAQANNSDDNPDNDGTGGYILKPGASVMTNWIWAFGGDIVDEKGKYTFNTPEAQEAATYLKDLMDSGCAWSGTNKYPNPEFATRQALFAVGSIAGLPYQLSAMKKANSTDEWTVVPFPSKSGTPVMDVYGPSMAIVKSSPEQQLASWLFIKWFTSPEIQAKWIEASGYFPTRQSTFKYLSDYVKAHPQWAAIRDLVEKGYGKFEPRDASWNAVRKAMGDAFAKVFQADFSKGQIPQVLQDLQKQAEDAWAEYHE